MNGMRRGRALGELKVKIRPKQPREFSVSAKNSALVRSANEPQSSTVDGSILTENRGLSAVEGSRPGIWKMPSKGGHETLLASGTQFLFTASWSEGICFLN